MSPQLIVTLLRTILADLLPVLEELAADSKSKVDDQAVMILKVLLGL